MKSQTIHIIRKRLLNSRFFTISLLLHGLLILVLGGTALVNKYFEPEDLTAVDGIVGKESQPAPPAPKEATERMPEFAQPSAPAAPVEEAIRTANPASPPFMPPQIYVRSISTEPAIQKYQSTDIKQFDGHLTPEAAADIGKFIKDWSPDNKEPGLGTKPLTERRFQFTAFIAKYGDPNDPQGPDWNSTNWVRDGRIAGGSLINMLYVIDKLSGDKIHTTPEVVPLDLSNWDEIAAKKPPFILFTGHRNFVLTDKEVENLQKYLRLGGCIWGDSSLPGNRSRFDIAFRREMKRVIPDVDIQFEPLPPRHPIFAKAYYPEIKSVPPGLNFYREPVYAMKLYGGEIAILYTANDYGDMWQIGFDEKMEIDMRRDEAGRLIAVNWGMFVQRNTYYRNLTRESLAASYKFGTNIIVHLLTRWDNHVAKAPHGL